MTKSGDSKVKTSAAAETAMEKKLHEYDGRAQAVPVEEASESDPLDTQNRAQNSRFQLAESQAAHEPDGLQWIDDARTVRWTDLLGAQLQRVGSEATQPGGQAERPKPVPKEERIQTANELAEAVHKLVHTAVAPNRWEKELNAARRTAVFGERPAPSSRAGWTTELTLVHGAIVTLGAAAPAALVKLLPRVEAALAALAASKAVPAGRPPRTPAYSAQVIVAAIALDLTGRPARVGNLGGEREALRQPRARDRAQAPQRREARRGLQGRRVQHGHRRREERRREE